MATTEKENDMIVEEPREDDVLLGQGHYRHPGNQRLNKVVDAKVDEYKNQSRVFKTYMAHDIINRMRSKGVRFLKELAPKGWIVVKDDKEAREKVAQRFQYMMRKQAEASKAAAKTTETPVKKQKPAKKSAAPSPRPNLSWNGVSVKVPFLPVFHQLEKSSVLVDDDVNAIAERLLECFKMTGVESSFNYEEACAVLTTADSVRMQMNLWKPLGGNGGVIVEIHDMEGDILVLQKYNRYILEAATGLFDRYKHNLFHSGATGSVKDHITAFSASGKAGAEDARDPSLPGSKRGVGRAFSERPLGRAFSERSVQTGKFRQSAGSELGEKKVEPDYLAVRGLNVKRFDQQQGIFPMVPKEPRLVPIAPRESKLLPIAPKPFKKRAPTARAAVKKRDRMHQQ